MSTTASPDLPTPTLDQVLVNARAALVELSRAVRHLEPEDLRDILPDLEELSEILSGIEEQARAISKVYNSRGRISSGCIVVKPINGCGPYGYLVTSTGGRRRSWRYLGKAEKGTASGIYPPGSSIRFETRNGSVRAEDPGLPEGGERNR